MGMVNNPPTKRLDSNLQEVSEHIEAGNQRIKSWYSQHCEQPDEYPELDRPPHQVLMKRGIKLINFADELANTIRFLDSPENDAILLLYGVGMERILSGIHLKIDSDDFIEHMEKNSGETPSIKYSSKILISNLCDEISDEQRGILKLVLEYVRIQRNNEAHLGYHRVDHIHMRRLVTEVAESVLRYYCEGDMQELDELTDIVKTLREREKDTANIDIKFDPDF